MKLITVHGIRTSDPWYRVLDEIETLNDRGVKILHFQYGRFGYFNILQFLNKKSRLKVISDFQEFYDREVEDGELPSIICHSFGTWIVFQSMSTFEEIKFNKCIMFGSILDPKTDWTPFFSNKQLKGLLHEVGWLDKVVKLSKWALGSEAGNSGQEGFHYKGKFKNKIIEKNYPKYSHSSAASLKKHIKQSWVPFIIKRNFNISEKILCEDEFSKIQKNSIGDKSLPNGLQYNEKSFHAYIDRMGQYSARYKHSIINLSDEPITKIPFAITGSGNLEIEKMHLCCMNSDRAHLNYTIDDDYFGKKKFHIQVDPISRNRNYVVRYKFYFGHTINLKKGDFDHFDIKRAEKIKFRLTSYHSLHPPRLFLTKNLELMEEVELTKTQLLDKRHMYEAIFNNSESHDGLIFYFESSDVRKNHEDKYGKKTYLKVIIDNKPFIIRSASEVDLDKVASLESRIEGPNNANRIQLNYRFRAFSDGFLVVEHKKKIIGYLQAIIWKTRKFERFDEIKDFPLHHNIHGNEMYVIFIAVSERFRRKGLATQMLMALDEIRTYYSINKTTLVAKDDIVELYKKNGFNIIRPLPNFLPNQPHGCILMEKT